MVEVLSTEYRRGTPSVQTKVCSTDRSHHQYCGGYAKWIRNIISMDEGVQYRTSKTVQGVFGGSIQLGE